MCHKCTMHELWQLRCSFLSIMIYHTRWPRTSFTVHLHHQQMGRDSQLNLQPALVFPITQHFWHYNNGLYGRLNAANIHVAVLWLYNRFHASYIQSQNSTTRHLYTAQCYSQFNYIMESHKRQSVQLQGICIQHCLIRITPHSSEFNISTKHKFWWGEIPIQRPANKCRLQTHLKKLVHTTKAIHSVDLLKTDTR